MPLRQIERRVRESKRHGVGVLTSKVFTPGAVTFGSCTRRTSSRKKTASFPSSTMLPQKNTRISRTWLRSQYARLGSARGFLFWPPYLRSCTLIRTVCHVGLTGKYVCHLVPSGRPTSAVMRGMFTALILNSSVLSAGRPVGLNRR